MNMKDIAKVLSVVGVWLVAAAACGSDEAPGGKPGGLDPHAGVTSGTRLKLRWYDFEGTRAVSEIFDAQRSEVCLPREVADGKVRCLPQTTPGDIVYADAACTQPLGFNTSRCPARKYFSGIAPNTCRGATASLYPRVDGATPQQYYSGGPGNCTGPRTVDRADQLSLLGPEIPLTEFVSMSLAVASEGSRMRAQLYEAADGARWLFSLYDTVLDAGCHLLPKELGSSSLQCDPVGAAGSSNSFVDDTCATRGAVLYSNSCPAPRYASIYDGTCELRGVFTAAPIVGQRAQTRVYSSEDGQCQSALLGPNDRLYELGAPLEQPALTVAPLEGRARIRNARLMGEEVAVPWLYDTELAAECNPVPLTGGEVRCLPRDFLVSTLMYSDASCQSPIHLLNVPAAGCEALRLPTFAVAFTAPAMCTGDASSREVRRVQGAYTGPRFSKTSQGDCFAVVDDTQSYSLSAPIPMEQFATATVVTDP